MTLAMHDVLFFLCVDFPEIRKLPISMRVCGTQSEMKIADIALLAF